MRPSHRIGRATATVPGGRLRLAMLGSVLAAAVLGTVAGCASSAPHTPSCAAPIPLVGTPTPSTCRTATPRIASHAAPPAATPSASPTPTAGSLPGGGALIPLDDDDVSDVGPTSALVAKGSGTDAPSIEVTTSAVAGQGVVSTDDTIAPPADGTVTGWVMGTQHDPTAPASGALARTVHTDASGLDPEAWTTSVQAFAPGTGLTGGPIVLRQCKTESCALHAADRFGSTVIVDYQPDAAADTTNRVVAIDLDAGTVAWSRDDAKLVSFSPTAAILERSDGQGNGGAEHPVSAVDPATGHVDWTFADRDHNPAHEIDPVLSERYAVITSDDENDPQSRSNLVDLTDGHVVAVRFGDGSWSLDPVAGRFVVSGTSGTAYGDSDLTVLSKTGSIVYGISHDRFEALNRPTVAGALDGRAWISSGGTTDAFDSATGEQDPDSPALKDNLKPPVPLRFDGSTIVMNLQGAGRAALLDPSGIPSYADFIALGSTSG